MSPHKPRNPSASHGALAHAEACRKALRHLHRKVRQIRAGDDQDVVVDALRECLHMVGVNFAGYGVNLIEAEGDDLRITQMARHPDGNAFRRSRIAPVDDIICRWWREGQVVHRRDLLADDPFDELAPWAGQGPAPRRCIVDVPFSGGTLAVNSLQPDAFSEADVEFLRDLSDVLGAATQRWQDLRQLGERNDMLLRRAEGLEEANLSLAEKERLLNAFHETGKALLGTIDLEVILDTLALQVIQAGIFRSIMVALVDGPRRKVRVTRSLTRKKDAQGLWQPALASSNINGIEYDLDDDNITAEVARTARMAVIDGFDPRFDDRLNKPTMPVKTSYFIPIVHNGHAVAVLAAGSQPGEREEMLRKIEVLGPFFDLFAIALHHAHLYRNLQERERELRESQKIEIMGELTAGIAHNFNNLLQGVIGNLDFALEVPDEAPKFVESALQASESLADMVRQLMSYSRKGLAPELGSTDLAAVVDSVVKVCRSTFDRRIEIHRHIDDGVPLIHGNAGQLEQVLLNLCVNARDGVSEVSGRTPRINIQAATTMMDERVMVMLQVQDNGIGIEPAVQARMFDPFFTTKEVGRGTGLGLSNAQGIISHHGGWINCDSTPGEGTTFTLFLPTETAAPTEQIVDSRPVVASGGGTVLVVEDEEAVRLVVERVLTRSGCTVLLAADGEQGLQMLTEQAADIDLVLLDMSLPKISGRELLERLPPQVQVPVVLFTGYAMPESISERVVATLEKPVSSRTLHACVVEVLQGAGPE